MKSLFNGLCTLLLAASGVRAADVAVPDELENWRGWALQDADYRRCPFLVSQSAADAQAFRCAWPGALDLLLSGNGGTFSQRWQIYADSWVVLPGNVEQWPIEVRASGKAVPVVLRNGVPQLRLGAGNYTITGRFSWARQPEQLAIASQSGIVNLTLNGRRIAQTERPNGALWLGQARTTATQQSLALQVYRLVQDEIPAVLITSIRLQAAGDGREVLLGRVLPEGFIATDVRGPLPARLDPDGRLRLQVRPGTFELTLLARGVGVATEVKRPATTGTWVDDEIWSFEGVDRLRVAAVEGPESIDPVQADVPEGWRNHPAYRMTGASIMRVAERSRGLIATDDNHLTLAREQWLDFDHAGFTVVDKIRGTMRTDWRLNMRAPYQLKSARIAEESQLITTTAAGTGVELRSPNIDLVATSRIESSRGALSATGWATRLDTASGTLHLPPGHRLLGVLGADEVYGSWWSDWTLWSLFGVLIVVAFTYRIAGRVVATIALCALLLTYMEAPSYVWLWANLLIAVALARASVTGRLAKALQVYRLASFVVLGVALLPFLWSQLRYAIYPQLEISGNTAYLKVEGANLRDFAAPAPAAPPAMQLDMPAPPVTDAVSQLEEVAVTAEKKADSYGFGNSSVGNSGRNASQNLQRYATGTLLQTGPGVPDWNYHNYSYHWSGPVAPEEKVRFVYIGPMLLALWRVLGVALVCLWFALIALKSFNGSSLLPTRYRSLLARLLTAFILVLMLPLLAPTTAEAASTPDSAVLQELRTRLLAPPRCAPSCGEINSAQVQISGNRIEIVLQASALASVALPVPNAADRWQLESVSVDGNTAVTLGRESDSSLWVPLSAGAHTVRLVAQLSSADSIQLQFTGAPRAITAVATGWDIAGIADGRLVSGSLELTRRRISTAQSATAGGAEFPSFVRVIRDFSFDTEWSIGTTVRRVAPATAAVTVEVPLIANESVLNSAIEIRQRGTERVALAGLGSAQNELEWNSALPRTETLQLMLPTSLARTEIWNFVVNPQWRVAFAGVPAVLPDDIAAPTWVYQYRPRPGETLNLTITRPTPVAGQVLAIDSVQQGVTYGARSANMGLKFSYRSTQGGRQNINIPSDARVQEVRVDDQPQNLRPENGVLSIALLPGSHRVAVDWQTTTGAAFRSASSVVDLHSSASNVTTTIAIPDNRWPLAVSRSLAGPVVRYWGELLVFLLTAFLLGRWSQSPLRAHEWLLLGIGLSTLSWFVFALVALWLFAVRWRAQWNTLSAKRWVFRSVQIGFALLSVIAVCSLVFVGIRYGFLSNPDMGIAGADSYGNSFHWFHDQVSSELPGVAVYSVPLWIYKALIFVWSLWIALALSRWLRQAWSAWTHGDAPPKQAKIVSGNSNAGAAATGS